MQFHEYQTIYQFYRNMGDHDAHELKPFDFYCKLMTGYGGRYNEVYTQLGMEANWYNAHQPYYSIWPAIVPPLLKLNLAVDASFMQPPIPELFLRLPVENNPLKFEFEGEKFEVQGIMMAKIDEIKAEKVSGVSVWIDIGEEVKMVDSGLGQRIYTYRTFSCRKGISLEEEISGLPKAFTASVGIVVPEDIQRDCIKLCCCMCLLENDPDVITADVLNRDRAKFDETGDKKYVEKAHRRGKVGWDIGKRLEMSPHIRIAHAALYWTGPGRTVPRILFRKGSIIHRKVIETVPTGYMEKPNENARNSGS